MACCTASAKASGYSGQVDIATTHFQHLVNRTDCHLGPNHPDTLVARRDLAWWQQAAGDAAGAVVAYAELLADQLRVLGADHPDTLTTRHGLAYSRGWQEMRPVPRKRMPSCCRTGCGCLVAIGPGARGIQVLVCGPGSMRSSRRAVSSVRSPDGWAWSISVSAMSSSW